MPVSKTTRRTGKDPKEDATLDEIIERNIEILFTADDEDKVMVSKGIVCKFYQEGKNPSCKFCAQEDETVLACTEAYVELMKRAPALVWSPELEKPKKREKVAVLDTGIGMLCDACYLADNCPAFEAHSECGIEWGDEAFEGKPVDIVKYLIKLQGERLTRAKAIELTDGGVPDQVLSTEMDRMSGLVATLNDMETPGWSLNINAKGNTGGGILSSIFGGMGKSELPAENTNKIPASVEGEIIELESKPILREAEK
jgi:hypothetical protein